MSVFYSKARLHE